MVATVLPFVMAMAGAGVVAAQDYPSKPIRIITGGAGGTPDFTSRVTGQGISAALGQPVIIDNRGGTIAIELVQKAPPDGYTLLVVGNPLWIGPHLRKSFYDPVTDFLPVSLVSRQPNIVVVHPALPTRSVKELIALAKSRPGELNYASAEVGGTSQLAAELFKTMSGASIVNVPYKGSAASITALIVGEVQLTFAGAGPVAPHVKAGRLRALAVTSAQPSALFPGLPTVAAAVPGYEAVSVTGMFVPAKTNAAIIRKLNQEVVRFLNTAEAKDRFFRSGSEVVASTPEELSAVVIAEGERLGKVIRSAGIKVE